MGLGRRRTNFNRIELEFRPIIQEIRNAASDNIPTFRGENISVVAKTVVFRDMSKLFCTEVVNETGEIEEFFYDWYDSSGIIIMKFHGHFHPKEAPDYIKEFDPYHLHKKKDATDLKAVLREKNDTFRTVEDILNFIKHSVYVANYYK